MIKCISSNKSVLEIVNKAFQRSFGLLKKNHEDMIFCFISPTSTDEIKIKELIAGKFISKILIFGKLSSSFAELIGLEHNNNKIELDKIDFSHEKREDRSNLFIQYNEHILNRHNPLNKRYFYRFDFTDEWNNLGYGKIDTTEDIWSVSNSLSLKDAVSLGDIYDNKNVVSVFASIKDFDNSSVLYINREVGLIDGLDYTIIEEYLSSYRNDKLPSLPLIKDVPNGFETIMSARLDCDQSVINAKPIFELYKEYGINITLAISTGIKIDHNDINFLNSFYEEGGDLLSHTINHYQSWGDCYQVAFNETYDSKKWLEKNINGLNNLLYAVSPFHSNKPYSVQALVDAGYKGFISGIIHNDPEDLLATSGVVPFVCGDIVSHSQQCMLHGDCYHRRENSINIEKESFKNHYKANKIFGYLDHPFGEYDYGWENEQERLSVHKEFITYINSFESIKWMTCSEILDFIIDKSSVELSIDNGELTIKRKSFNSKEQIKIVYKNKEYIC